MIPPGYPWSCAKCGVSNGAGLTECASCGCPAAVSAEDIAARSGSKPPTLWEQVAKDAAGFFVLILILVWVVTPFLGFDPIGEGLDRLRGETPWFFVALNTSVFLSACWVDWRRYEREGDLEKFVLSAMKWAVLWGIMFVAILIEVRSGQRIGM